MSIETIINKVIDEWEESQRVFFPKFHRTWRDKLIKELHQELISMTGHGPCHYDINDELD